MTATQRDWKTAFLSYLKPKMLAMMALGFASGLPFMMYYSKLSRWLSEVDIDKATIGFFFFIGFAYGLKFLWAPIVDRARIPILTEKLGQRRSWMVLAVLGTVLGMIIISTANPSPDIAGSLTPIIIGTFILAYSGATLDISVDAWRIESAPNSEQAAFAAVYQLGYRGAIMFAGFALIFADWFSWGSAYQMTAATMAIVIIVILFVKEPTADSRNVRGGSFAENLNLYVAQPFMTFVKHYGAWVVPVLLLVCFYRLSDFTMGVMTQPLYEDLGYSKSAVGVITGIFGPWPSIVGTFVSGIFCVRFGLMRTLLMGAVLAVFTNWAFAWLSLQEGAVIWHLGSVIVADNFATGFVATVFIAYMSALVDIRYAATQYALLSSGYALLCKFIAGFSGVLYEAVGAVWFFTVTALYGIPAIVLILIIWKFGPAKARGIEDPDSETRLNSEPV